MQQYEIRIYQRIPNLSIPVLYGSLNSPRSPKLATDSSDPKFGHSFTITQLPRRYPVNERHSIFHVKFEVRFVSFSTRKTMPNVK
jgi:hypothetical protein